MFSFICHFVFIALLFLIVFIFILFYVLFLLMSVYILCFIVVSLQCLPVIGFIAVSKRFNEFNSIEVMPGDCIRKLHCNYKPKGRTYQERLT
jgi:hypothetical protein